MLQNSLSRVAILKIGQGSFEQGFAVSLQIREDHGSPIAELEGQLPANLEIESLYLCWQQAFRSLTHRDRSADDWEIDQSLITHRSTREDIEACRQFAKALETSLRTWLKSTSDGWQRIRDRITKELATHPDRIRFVIQAQDPQLWKLPWQTWDLFHDYPQVGIGYSFPNFEQPDVRDRTAEKSKPVRILAILGNDNQLDLKPDETAIQQLENTDSVFLHQPTAQTLIRQLRDDRGWDIFFFAGHSQSEADTGRIYLNDRESLEVDQFRNALREAIRKGLQIAIFNSCDGLGFAQRLASLQIPVVICMQERVPDQVAQSFLKEFLIEYSKDQDLYTAVRRSQDRLEEFQDLPSATWLPILYQNPAEVPPSWRSLRGITPKLAPVHQLSRIGLRYVALGAVLIAGMVTWTRSQGNFQTWELQSYDQLLRQQPTEPIDPRLLIVGADEGDLHRYGFPIPDAILVQVLQKLNQSKPAAIGIDLVRDRPNQQLLTQLKSNANFIPICAIGGTNRENSIASPPGISENQLGFVDAYNDEQPTHHQDFTVRRYFLSITSNLVSTPSRCPTSYSLALHLLDRYFTPKNVPITVESNQWKFGSLLVQRLTPYSGGYQNLDDRGNQSLIRYRNTSDPHEIARQINFRSVLENNYTSDLVKGRIVLMGVTAPSVPDRFNTPYGTLRGLHLHAHMVSQILSAIEDQRRLIHWLPIWGDAIWILAWSFAGGILAWRFLTLPKLSLALGITVVVLYGCCWVALFQGLWIPLVPSAIALLLTSSTVAIAERYLP
jgi:CHASE2 domain-containing sensor protein